MKISTVAFAATLLAAAPAAAATMSCSDYIALDKNAQITEVERLEPKSVEEKGTKTGDVSKGSSGAAGTVDPNMTEADKAGKLLAACHANPDQSTAEAMTAAFK